VNKQLRRAYREAKSQVARARGALLGGDGGEAQAAARPQVLLLDNAGDTSAWRSLRKALAPVRERLGDRLVEASGLSDVPVGQGPRCILCLGPASREFLKPGLSPMLQFLDSAPRDASELLVTNRDADLVLCLESGVAEELASQLPRKEIRDASVGLQEEVDRFLSAFGLGAELPTGPLRNFRRAGPRLVDVYMTTSRRPQFFERAFEALLAASAATPHRVRLNVFVDEMDDKTLRILTPHLSELGLLSTSTRLGLPFLYNMILDHQQKVDARSEDFADYLCYLQDDCLITDPGTYFDRMVQCYEEVLPVHQVGYVSGFYCPIHPGFEVVEHRDMELLLSDSVDGKNFMATPSLLRCVGALSWHFKDGERRGNPGPGRGSHFVLWQWLVSPQALVNQGRVSIVVAGLCVLMAQSAADSTWGNETSEQVQLQRRAEGRVYNTRGTLPPLMGQSPSGPSS